MSDQQIVARRSLLESIWATLRPVPIPEPVLDPHLNEMTTLGRIAEISRYQLQQLEYALSSGGHLRGFIRLNLMIGVVLLVPTLVVVPALTILFGSFVTMTAFLMQAAINLLHAVLAVLAAMASVMAFISILKFWLGNGGRGSRRR